MSEPIELGDERPLLPFLPLIYVAWADGELTEEERAAIAARIAAHGGLDAGCRARLERWMRPESPPSARELQAILRTIRRVGGELPEAARRSLADLGAEMARACCGPDEADPVTPAVREALTGLEEALGVAGAEATRGLLVGERPEAAAEPGERAFDPALLTAALDAPYGDDRRRVRELLGEPRFAYLVEPSRDAYREQVLAWCRILADEGLGALSLPERYGGAADVGRFIAVFETLAFHDASLLVKFGVQFGLFAGSILQLGTRKHHDAWLADAGALELPGCFAMSETGHGSNVAEVGTVARYLPDSDEIEVHTPAPEDRKDWIGNAALHGRLATVFAQLEVGGDAHGVHAVMVPIRSAAGEPLPGVTIEDCGPKEGLNGVDNGRLSFDRVRVSRDHLLDRFASIGDDGTYSSPIPSPTKRFFTMLGTLVGGRISVAAAANSAAKTGLAIAVRYAARRRQFGPPGRPETRILDYRSHQRRLMPRVAACYAIDFAHRDLVRRFVEHGEDEAREVETVAAGLKAYASWHNIATLQECREACGGQGYLAINRIPALRDDTDVYTTFEGDNTVLMQLVAKGRLTEYRHQFSDLGFTTILNVLGHRAATALTELNPVVTRRTDVEHLMDPEFQRAAFRYREERLVRSAARRLKARIDAGAESFAAFNECQNHLLEMAAAAVERGVVDGFLDAAEAHRDAPFGEALAKLAALYALWRIERRRGWFLESGYLEAAKSKAIRAQVTLLCGEAREVALELTDAWAIPDAVLAAPIAFGGHG